MPGPLQAASGLSGLDDPLRAADQVCARIESLLARPCDLVVLCLSRSLAEAAADITRRFRERLSPGTIIGAVGGGVLAGALESEEGHACAALAIRGVSASPFAVESPEGLREAIGSSAATLFFADTTSIPTTALVEAVKEHSSPVLGACLGPKSGRGQGREATIHGPATLIVDGQVRQRGLVGVRLDGDRLNASTLVSQGCRPIGEHCVVTKASRNIVYQLGGRPAAQVLKEVLEGEPANVRQAARSGVLLGRVVDEYLPRFGRGDYLIRDVARVLKEQDALALNDFVKVGQTVRFHVRDRRTAEEDLALLLDVQKLHGPPAAAITLVGEGRGRVLFGKPNHDAAAISRAFDRMKPGPELAKPGKPIDTGPGSLAMTGLFSTGEICPVAGRALLHTHSVCSLLLRQSPD